MHTYPLFIRSLVARKKDKPAYSSRTLYYFGFIKFSVPWLSIYFTFAFPLFKVMQLVDPAHVNSSLPNILNLERA